MSKLVRATVLKSGKTSDNINYNKYNHLKLIENTIMKRYIKYQSTRIYNNEVMYVEFNYITNQKSVTRSLA